MSALGRDIVVMLLSQTFILLPLFTLYRLKELNALFPVIVLLTVWATDTCAYFVGKSLGKRKLAPAISPKKTIAGLAGAVLGGAILMAIFGGYMGMKPLESLVIGGVVGLLGQLGDIFESVGKRVFAVKDSSTLIPGHGGILDRIDSFLFTTPFVYHYLAGFGG
jgi:phosphatidate cytidylyltransferase